MTIAQQIDAKNVAKGGTFGQALKSEELDHFSAEQLAQLYELYQETSKPQDEYPKI